MAVEIELDSVQMSLAVGDVYCLVGINGAGKSTLIRVLAGLQRPSSGKVLIGGYDVRHQPLKVKGLIGLVTSDIVPYSRLTGREYAVFTAGMFGLTEQHCNGEICALFDVLGLTEHENKLVVNYSDGMRRKLAIVCSMVHRPKVLILDEPFSGIDEIAIEAILPLIKAAALDGAAVLIVDHNLEVLDQVCNRYGVIQNGRIVLEGSVHQNDTSPKLIDVLRETLAKAASDTAHDGQ